MKKLNLLLVASLTSLPLLLSGCGGNSASTESQTVVESTESETFYVTAGVYISLEDFDGYKQAKFVNEFGQEFLANITADTEVPEIFEEGKTYEIVHTDVLTASVPGVYPEVSKIILVDYDLTVMETMEETPASETDAETVVEQLNESTESETEKNKE